MILDLVIERLGTDGAGLAATDSIILAVPGALPGERVRVRPGPGRSSATLVERLTDSPQRIAPACRHFGTCGGCRLQHLAATAYFEFKQRLLADALARQGITDVDMAPVAISPPASRRRASLALRRIAGGAVAGFHEPESDRIVDLEECPILLPSLVALVAPLRRLAARLAPAGGITAVLEATASGVDLGLVLARAPGLGMLQDLAAFAAETDLARLWWRVKDGAATPLAERRRPRLNFDGIEVDLPAGGFQQASSAGEAALREAIRAAVAPAARIADLYAGLGTFALPLARTHAVHAVESDRPALAALAQAAGRAMLQRVTTEARDLDRRPLRPADLARFDTVIFDPPRAGARAQAAELARSTVPVVIAVSCNPATFARDAAALLAGGYRIDRLVPVDQFLWSTHLELVAVFRRG